MSDINFDNSKMFIEFYEHPTKPELLTIAGDYETDIPPVTNNFLFGSAGINAHELPDSN
jgi:hypothetical protein